MDPDLKEIILINMMFRLISQPEFRPWIEELFTPERLQMIRFNGIPEQTIPDVELITTDEYVERFVDFMNLGIDSVVEPEEDPSTVEQLTEALKELNAIGEYEE
jgi:hypothetical protein